MNSKQYLNEHRILLYCVVSQPKKESKYEIYDDEGIHCGYYVPDEFLIHSAYVNIKVCPVDNIGFLLRKIIKVVCYLNRDHSYDVLWGYIQLIIRERMGSPSESALASSVTNLVKPDFKERFGGDYDLEPETRKYYWTETMSHNKKLSLMATDRRKRMKDTTYGRIINEIEKSSNRGLFITQMGLSRELGLSYGAMKTHMSDYVRRLIITHNEKTFGTSNWDSFVRNKSVDKIIKAIDKLRAVTNKITRKMIQEETHLSYKTVCNLWDTDRIQETLNEYNEYVDNLKLNN